MSPQAPDLMSERGGEPGAQARFHLRTARQATLSTLDSDGSPYGSLVLVATLADGCPLLLISNLAVHTRNLASDPRCSLMIDATAGYADPLTGPRLTVTGRAVSDDAAAAGRARFLARHPGAARYAGFGDFAFWRVHPARGHLVADFGAIDDVSGPDLVSPAEAAAAIAEVEPGAVAHMNTDHAGEMRLMATRLGGCPDGDWRMIGCDPDGFDMVAGDLRSRLTFDRPVANADQLRAAMVVLTRRARGDTG